MIWIWMSKAIVQGWLALEEILLIILGTRSIRLHISASGTRLRTCLLMTGFYFFLLALRNIVHPDIIVAVTLVRIFLGRLLKPGTLGAGMSCHQVETNLHATLMGLIDQSNQIGIGTESRIYLVEIDDIIATIKPSRLKDRIEPEGVHTQRLDVIQLGSDTRQIANTIAISIHIGRWINLIEKCITQPSRSLLLFCLSRKCGCRQSSNQQHFIHSFHEHHY